MTPFDLFGRPLALRDDYKAILLAARHAAYLRMLEDGRHVQVLALEGVSANRCYDIVDGIAVVPVMGVLVHDCWWYGEVEYACIERKILAALNDPDVRGVALHINSPGGDVAGCFDLADKIYSVRGVKPIWAILDEMACSAAYALACSADRILVPRTGIAGSIGVVSMHLDATKFLDEVGLKITTFQHGARKTDTYPTTPLSDEAKERFQADVDALGDMFDALVARNRNLDVAKVRDLEAAFFLGEKSVALGLADEVASPDEAFLKFVAAVA